MFGTSHLKGSHEGADTSSDVYWTTLLEDDECRDLLSSEDNDSDEELEETLTERLVGLGEMFPDCMRCTVDVTTQHACRGVAILYRVSRVGMWLLSTSMLLLALPVMLEVDRTFLEEKQVELRQQTLLGPNMACSKNLGSARILQ